MASALKKITPEEKLLHLIENSQDINQLSIKKRKIKTGTPAPDASFKFSVPFNLSFAGILKKITFGAVIKALIALCVILTLFLIFYLVKEDNVIRERFRELKAKDTDKEIMSLKTETKEIPDSTTFVAEIEKSDPFHLTPFKKEEYAALETQVKSDIDLKLVGILWSDRAQAIIEDSLSAKTYVVSAGDVIENYTVLEITQTEVKLNSKNGETAILT